MKWHLKWWEWLLGLLIGLALFYFKNGDWMSSEQVFHGMAFIVIAVIVVAGVKRWMDNRKGRRVDSELEK